jgi:hypothetical protein
MFILRKAHNEQLFPVTLRVRLIELIERYDALTADSGVVSRVSLLTDIHGMHGISSATYTRQSSASRPILVMTLPTWITVV